MYVYKQSEPQLWTVGTYVGEKFEPESDHDSVEEAAERVRYLNGGEIAPPKDVGKTRFTDEDVLELAEKLSALELRNMKLVVTGLGDLSEKIKRDADDLEEASHLYECSVCNIVRDDRHGDPSVVGPSHDSDDGLPFWTCPECILKEENAGLRAENKFLRTTIKPVIDCVSSKAGEPDEGVIYSFSFAFGSGEQDVFQAQLKALFRLKTQEGSV